VVSKPINVGRMRAPKKLPTVGDLCTDIRDGLTTAEIAAMYEVGEGWIRTKIRNAGFDPNTGNALARRVLPPSTRSERPAWMDAGRCVTGGNPDAFFPIHASDTAAAKQACASCPVRAECLAYALEHDQRYGVWGGLDETERDALRRRRGRRS
jgi:WhiB family transcriptional regulator, redox-sensing transcriptional regulator